MKKCQQCQGTGIHQSIFKHDTKQCWRCEGTGHEPDPLTSLERFIKEGKQYASRAKEAQRKKASNEKKA